MLTTGEHEAFVRPLSFDLNEVQLRAVKASIAKLEGAHKTRVAWFGDHSLEGNALSIHALDMLAVLGNCRRDSETEMDLFRLRKTVMDKLNDLAKSARNEIKKQNLEMWLESYKKLWLGSESTVDISSAQPQPSRIELIP
ncbi:MAG: hypothetical protein IPK68_11080 [Bdellovibrionales bacterium]|nr:hypothetical protein [Bdellovibrionales bacterium]